MAEIGTWLHGGLGKVRQQGRGDEHHLYVKVSLRKVRSLTPHFTSPHPMTRLGDNLYLYHQMELHGYQYFWYWWCLCIQIWKMEESLSVRLGLQNFESVITNAFFFIPVSAKSYPIAMLSRSVNYETKDMLQFVSLWSWVLLKKCCFLY